MREPLVKKNLLEKQHEKYFFLTTVRFAIIFSLMLRRGKTSFFQKGLIGLLLLTVIGLQFSLFAWGHFHVDESGNLVYHAHPIGETGTKTHQHHHNKADFQALSQVLSTLTLLLLVLAILLSWLTKRRHTVFGSVQSPYTRFTAFAISRRGPPAVTVAS